MPPCAWRRSRRRRKRIGEREEMLRETGMAAVNGTRIYYEAAGEGVPLVLVHAGIADSRMWEGQLAAFADRYQVIRYDMRGFGRTARAAGPCSTSRSSTRREQGTSSWWDPPRAGSGRTSIPRRSGTR